MSTLIKELEDEIQNQSIFFNGQPFPVVNLFEVERFLNAFKSVLFPGAFCQNEQPLCMNDVPRLVQIFNEQLQWILTKFTNNTTVKKQLEQKILKTVIPLKQRLANDINAIYNGDPAAMFFEEVILAYPSFEAIMIYRIAHELSQLGLSLLARMCASIAHRSTGIDIHPNARIGHHFCIDHGTAIVIGETATIGNYVKLYQGVTIGALSVSKSQQNKKRHPTIEDHVTIYARTTILGGDTVIGENSIIGGNVWLTSSVPKNSKIYAAN